MLVLGTALLVLGRAVLLVLYEVRTTSPILLVVLLLALGAVLLVLTRTIGDPHAALRAARYVAPQPGSARYVARPSQDPHAALRAPA